MAYIGTQPKDVRSFGRAKFDFTATQGQTAFTGADDDSKTLGFTNGQIEVYVNGILMDESDFTTSNGNTVTLTSAANLNDVISIVAMQTDIPNSDYVPASGGTFSGNITASGTLGVTGAVTASNGLTVDDDGATPLTVDRATSFGNIIDVQKDGASVGAVGSPYGGELYIQGTGANSSGLLFTSGNTIQPRKNSAADDGNIDIGASGNKFKDLYLGGGVYIGGTGAVNKLDDYEEGTWTPVIGGATTTSGQVYNQQNGTYTKIGNLVTAHAYVAITNVGTVTGAYAYIMGLPFPITNNSGAYPSFAIGYFGTTSQNASSFTAYGNKGSSFAYITYRQGAGTSSQYLSPAGIGNSAWIFTMTYTTES
jgi:hypothetical protein